MLIRTRSRSEHAPHINHETCPFLFFLSFLFVFCAFIPTTLERYIRAHRCVFVSFLVSRPYGLLEWHQFDECSENTVILDGSSSSWPQSLTLNWKFHYRLSTHAPLVPWMLCSLLVIRLSDPWRLSAANACPLLIIPLTHWWCIALCMHCVV